jgi:hypothetical protein
MRVALIPGMRNIMISIPLLCAMALPVAADPADKAVGLGLGVGIATGPNLQLMTSERTHVDVGVGFEMDDRLRVQSDYAWRLASIASSASVHVPLYLGVGAFLSDHRYGATDGGVRMPIGLQADFSHAPIQVFGELSPELVVVQVVDNNMAPPPPDTLAVTGLMGVRAAF